MAKTDTKAYLDGLLSDYSKNQETAVALRQRARAEAAPESGSRGLRGFAADAASVGLGISQWPAYLPKYAGMAEGALSGLAAAAVAAPGVLIASMTGQDPAKAYGAEQARQMVRQGEEAVKTGEKETKAISEWYGTSHIPAMIAGGDTGEEMKRAEGIQDVAGEFAATMALPTGFVGKASEAASGLFKAAQAGKELSGLAGAGSRLAANLAERAARPGVLGKVLKAGGQAVQHGAEGMVAGAQYGAISGGDIVENMQMGGAFGPVIPSAVMAWRGAKALPGAIESIPERIKASKLAGEGAKGVVKGPKTKYEGVMPQTPAGSWAQSMAKVNPAAADEFALKHGMTMGDYMVSHGTLKGTVDDTVMANYERYRRSLDEVDAGMEAIQGKFKNPDVSSMARKIAEDARTVAKASGSSSARMEAAKWASVAKQAETEGMTMAEINNLKRKYEASVKMRYGQEPGSAQMEAAKALDSDVRNFQRQAAEEAGFGNLAEKNRETMAFRDIADAVAKKHLRQESNNVVSLTDYIMFAADPRAALVKVLAKGFKLGERFHSAAAKSLNKIGRGPGTAAELPVDFAAIQAGNATRAAAEAKAASDLSGLGRSGTPSAPVSRPTGRAAAFRAGESRENAMAGLEDYLAGQSARTAPASYAPKPETGFPGFGMPYKDAQVLGETPLLGDRAAPQLAAPKDPHFAAAERALGLKQLPDRPAQKMLGYTAAPETPAGYGAEAPSSPFGASDLASLPKENPVPTIRFGETPTAPASPAARGKDFNEALDGFETDFGHLFEKQEGVGKAIRTPEGSVEGKIGSARKGTWAEGFTQQELRTALSNFRAGTVPAGKGSKAAYDALSKAFDDYKPRFGEKKLAEVQGEIEAVTEQLGASHNPAERNRLATKLEELKAQETRLKPAEAKPTAEEAAKAAEDAAAKNKAFEEKFSDTNRPSQEEMAKKWRESRAKKQNAPMNPEQVLQMVKEGKLSESSLHADKNIFREGEFETRLKQMEPFGFVRDDFKQFSDGDWTLNDSGLKKYESSVLKEAANGKRPPEGGAAVSAPEAPKAPEGPAARENPSSEFLGKFSKDEDVMKSLELEKKSHDSTDIDSRNKARTEFSEHSKAVSQKLRPEAEVRADLAEVNSIIKELPYNSHIAKAAGYSPERAAALDPAVMSLRGHREALFQQLLRSQEAAAEKAGMVKFDGQNLDAIQGLAGKKVRVHHALNTNETYRAGYFKGTPDEGFLQITPTGVPYLTKFATSSRGYKLSPGIIENISKPTAPKKALKVEYAAPEHVGRKTEIGSETFVTNEWTPKEVAEFRLKAEQYAADYKTASEARTLARKALDESETKLGKDATESIAARRTYEDAYDKSNSALQKMLDSGAEHEKLMKKTFPKYAQTLRDQFGFKDVLKGSISHRAVEAVINKLGTIAKEAGIDVKAVNTKYGPTLGFNKSPTYAGVYKPSSRQIHVGTVAGAGDTFAHEYGHFLDYMLGSELRKTVPGGVTASDFGNVGHTKNPAIDALNEALIAKIVPDEKGVVQSHKPSEIYKRTVEESKSADYRAGGSYYREPTEIFARGFEKAIGKATDKKVVGFQKATEEELANLKELFKNAFKSL